MRTNQTMRLLAPLLTGLVADQGDVFGIRVIDGQMEEEPLDRQYDRCAGV